MAKQFSTRLTHRTAFNETFDHNLQVRLHELLCTIRDAPATAQRRGGN